MRPTIIEGARGEDLAVKYLKKQKYKIVDRNYACPTGEIDIIALDKDVLVFVEVKTRNSGMYGLPREAVNNTKQFKIAKTAQFFMHQKQVFSLQTRFDVIEVFDEEINHIKNAFCTNLL